MNANVNAAPEPASTERLTTLQILTLLLSVYVLMALTMQSFFSLDPAAQALLEQIDFYVCLVFLTDFFVRFYQAPSKAAFLKWGWIDFISSIPMLEAFRVGRVVRMVRIIRILRAFRSTRYLLTYLLHDRKATSFAAVACIFSMLVGFSSIAMLQFETLPDSTIKTPGDALWWAFTTITTVGYGDRVPVSLEGRVIACILMTAGVGLFGSFTGFVASLFVEPEQKREQTEILELTREIGALRAQMQMLLSRLDAEAPLLAAARPVLSDAIVSEATVKDSPAC